MSMFGFSVDFEPLIPLWLLAVLALTACATGLFASRRGRGLRVLAIGALALALANPSLVEEERTALPDVLVAVADESRSMTVGGRADARDAALTALRAQAANDPTLDLIEVSVGDDADGTLMFEALAEGLGEAPRGRLAGAVLITDGRVHDAPENADSIGLDAPLHAMIVGDREGGDRRLVIAQAPVFGIVNDMAAFTVRVEDVGRTPAQGEDTEVVLRLDGGDPLVARARIGEDTEIRLPIRFRGPNVVEIEVEEGPQELTLDNNRAAVSISGVRDRLRVLLITGEPHAGARTWRDLLKSDPSVDLVQFVILRPPERNEVYTPQEELSLIEFPTQELFEEQLENFDLVIFDRYRRRGVIDLLYIDNIARYVEDGGALLIAAGPMFASPISLYRTSLSGILPVRPTSSVVEEGFRPNVTDDGRAHPVTADLSARASLEAGWGRWFRMIEGSAVSGRTLLNGPRDLPLLVLDRQGDGRVAMLMSDHAWLWARGFEGGGPHGELFRRLAHWLMQEPELEEERLSGAVVDDVLQIARRTMGEAAEPVTVTTPTGDTVELVLTPAGDGLFTAETPARETGLYSLQAGDLSTTASSGPINPPELADLTPSADILTPAVDAQAGGAVFIGEGGALSLPDLRRVRAGDAMAGAGWLGLVRNGDYIVDSQDRRPLAPALLAVALALSLMGLAWAREGR